MRLLTYTLLASSCLLAGVATADDGQAAIEHVQPAELSWANVTASDMDARIGETISLLLADGAGLDLTIAEIVLGPDDPARPDFLARKRSFTIILTPPDADAAWLSKPGLYPATVNHDVLGQGELAIGIYPTEDGGRVVETILN